MSGTYGYFKVAKLKFMDASSNLVIDSSNALLASVNTTANNIITNTLNWDNAYDPDPTNNEYPSMVIDGSNIEFGRMTVSGTTNLVGTATLSSLGLTSLTSNAVVATTADVSGNLVATTLNAGVLNLTSLNVVSVSAGSVGVSGNVSLDNLVFNDELNSTGFFVDSLGNVNCEKLNVTDNVTLADLYVDTNVTVNQNVSVSQNLSVIQNKYIDNSVCIGSSGHFQMWDGSGYNDPSGFIVNLSATQLQQLLTLI